MLTLNIVHTNYGEHHLFTKGNKLHEQLSELVKVSGLKVQILFNGADTLENYQRFDSIPSGIKRFYSEERLTHGSSLQILLDHSQGWCISIDEDDEFHEGYSNNLWRISRELQYCHESALFTFEFDWSYVSPNTGKIHVKRHPLNFENGGYDANSIISLSNWNLIFNINYLRSNNVRRPNINQFDDVIWYHYLYLLYEGKMRIFPVTLINYHKENATLSKNEDPTLKNILGLVVAPEVFELTEQLFLNTPPLMACNEND